MKVLLIGLSLLVLNACGSAKGAGIAIAHEIGSPTEGYKCFSIEDQSGNVLGGNCVKE